MVLISLVLRLSKSITWLKIMYKVLHNSTIVHIFYSGVTPNNSLTYEYSKDATPLSKNLSVSGTFSQHYLNFTGIG